MVIQTFVYKKKRSPIFTVNYLMDILQNIDVLNSKFGRVIFPLLKFVY